MEINRSKKEETNKDERATLAGPAPYEEELKDHSKENEEDLIDSMPDAHPEPRPGKNDSN